jgi:hypothetical protein
MTVVSCEGSVGGRGDTANPSSHQQIAAIVLTHRFWREICQNPKLSFWPLKILLGHRLLAVPARYAVRAGAHSTCAFSALRVPA